MKKIMISWIGKTDLNASKGLLNVGDGPILNALNARTFDAVCLISNYDKEQTKFFLEWLTLRTSITPQISYEKLSTPTSFKEIHEAAVKTLTQIQKNHGKDIELTFHISPGTSQMAAVWIILSKTRFPAELIESSREQGVKTTSLPFDISAEFIPDLLHKSDRALEGLSSSLPPDTPEFSEIIHKSRVMKRILGKAKHVAPRSIPVLIEGESGTGKELLARAIHKSSPRYDKKFITVNCGAIPHSLVESELFGHEKGAFTGADKQRKGYFEAANSGTLFLDEIGELPLDTQVKLLRALQEYKITRIGSTTAIDINVRIIAATNRNLIEEIEKGNFRSDLFYRIAVAILLIPPLRERSGDIGFLIDRLLKKINEESIDEPGYVHKKISPSAKNLMINHPWPGNVRELLNTLRRAAIWTMGDTIENEDMRDALIPVSSKNRSDILNRPIGEGFNIQDIMKKVAEHYLYRALEEAKGNKTEASKLVGLPSYQTFSNWMKKYGIK